MIPAPYATAATLAILTVAAVVMVGLLVIGVVVRLIEGWRG